MKKVIGKTTIEITFNLKNVVGGGETMMRILRGDIFYIKKSGFVTGSEQESGRPAIIVSNDVGNEHSGNVEVVYLTTQEKTHLPTHVEVICQLPSTALCEAVVTVSKERLGNYIRSCTDEEMQQIDTALMISLGLNHGNIPDTSSLEMELKDLKLICEEQKRMIGKYESENTDLLAKVEVLENQPLFPEDYDPHEATVLKTERDLYKKQYEALLERLLAK